jgi:hypothetical protein
LEVFGGFWTFLEVSGSVKKVTFLVKKWSKMTFWRSIFEFLEVRKSVDFDENGFLRSGGFWVLRVKSLAEGSMTGNKRIVNCLRV